ncbi:oxidoreductase [Mycobacterium sp. MS1601]|uniref:SDR family NAD(P)-dependent oxidoreductase n=1 Tax=Mycobacterium sp. MS1601 TaxID=1936029 RepID=UPI0009796C2C|nr:SDR family NAD(P)-dependent oxidoreductase [Mycobacterium sp. MS1601]AQA04970.1 oxidoreductase [Mycobacterium sp. MS1601]
MKDTGTGVVVIFGGRSEIGTELASRLAAGREVVLTTRGSDALDQQVSALTAAGASAVHVKAFDADDLGSHVSVLDEISVEHGPIGTAVLAFGILGDQARAEVDADHAVAIVHTDYVAQVSLLTELSKRMRGVGGGRIVVFSSIAGNRVRRANYVYGSAKAGLDGFASGLADALHGSGVQLLMVRPGFVIGRMTEGMDPAPLSSTPAQVADAAARALAKGKRSVWVPGSLAVLAFVMRLLPQAIWRRMPR